MGMIDGKGSGFDQMSPTARLDLNKEEAKGAREFKPGNVVKVTIVGTVTDLSFHKQGDPSMNGFEGSMCLDIRDMEIGISSKNAIAALLDDDE